MKKRKKKHIKTKKRRKKKSLQRGGSVKNKSKKCCKWHYVKSNKTGSYGGSVGNAGNNRAFPFNYTINSANTWERKVIKIPGDTTGTWNRDNSLSIKVTMSLGSGSDFTGTANQWNAAEDMAPTSHVNWMDSTSNNYYITGVQFEEGDEVTPFEHRSFIEEILL